MILFEYGAGQFEAIRFSNKFCNYAIRLTSTDSGTFQFGANTYKKRLDIYMRKSESLLMVPYRVNNQENNLFEYVLVKTNLG